MLPPATHTTRFPPLTVAQLAVSIAGGLISILGIVILLISNQIAQVDSSSNQINPHQVWSTAILLGILAILCIPSIVLSLRTTEGHRTRGSIGKVVHPYQSAFDRLGRVFGIGLHSVEEWAAHDPHARG